MFTISSQAKELPNETDLQAAYCSSIIKSMITTLTPLASVSQDYASKQMVNKELSKLNDNLQRIQSYINPRLNSLDSTSILAAVKRGEEDNVRAGHDSQNCYNSCKKDKSCLLNCIDTSKASLRMRKCNELTFLPY
jgi:hypothetical protein